MKGIWRTYTSYWLDTMRVYEDTNYRLKGWENLYLPLEPHLMTKKEEGR
jgi:hypothetical protein